MKLTVVVDRRVGSVLGGRVLGVGVDVWYRVVGIVVHAAAVVLLLYGGLCAVVVVVSGKRLMRKSRRRLAHPVLASVARVRYPVQRHPVNRPVDHGHQVFERGAHLLQVTGQHGRGIGGQSAPEPGARAHPVHRQSGAGHVQRQVRVRRRCAA